MYVPNYQPKYTASTNILQAKQWKLRDVQRGLKPQVYGASICYEQANNFYNPSDNIFSEPSVGSYLIFWQGK